MEGTSQSTLRRDVGPGGGVGPGQNGRDATETPVPGPYSVTSVTPGRHGLIHVPVDFLVRN